MARSRTTFKNGNKHGKGGKRRGSGRPTKAKEEAKKLVKKLVFDMAKQYLEDHFLPIMEAYVALASGVNRKLDPATCRHAVERAIGPAPRTLHLDLQDSIESFFDRVMEEGGKDG